MISGAMIAEIAALAGDPARANILTALLDGRAMTATELAYAARVTPQTTSAAPAQRFQFTCSWRTYFASIVSKT